MSITEALQLAGQLKALVAAGVIFKAQAQAKFAKEYGAALYVTKERRLKHGNKRPRKVRGG